jgi:diguanylate cyclase (GGDEF)-like protein
MPRFKPRIRTKFFLVLAVLLPVVFGLPAVGVHGLLNLRYQAELLYETNFTISRLSERVGDDLDANYEVALRLSQTNDPRVRDRLKSEAVTKLIPPVERDIDALRRATHGFPQERASVEKIERSWRRYLALSQRRLFNSAGTSALPSQGKDAVAEKLDVTFEAMTSQAASVSASEDGEAAATDKRVQATYRSTRDQLVALWAASIIVGLGAIFWLIRDIVPRTRNYSRFASRVASGEAIDPIEPQGSDELADLGRTLNEMVARTRDDRAYDATQAEYGQAMQMTESEQEAHGLLKRHLERSISGSDVLILNRNNSENRLKATTPLTAGSPLREGLADAEPRSCLAVRFGQRHEESPDLDSLLECELCGKRGDERSTCEPLLVSGEVIGSVLVQHDDPLAADEDRRIVSSVRQGAPVLANLRNLAIAELRAATDALTGLPNNRSVQGTLKRMAAQASRTVSPLGCALLDLDHFKQINDTYGHGRGDEVLAAVASALQSTLRDSDFVGRWGGEEFLILLPDVDREGAMIAAEKIRASVASVTVPGIDRAITASLGVAMLPDDAVDVTTLARNADRALYTAKANGRNCVETFSALEGPAFAPDAPVLG